MAAPRTLDTAECWRRLASVDVGRLAVVLGRVPDIFPVSHAVDGETLLFHTGLGSKATALGLSPMVAFEADGYDGTTGEVWSIVVKGRASVMHGGRLALALLLPVHPLYQGPDTVVVRVTPGTVTGRSFGGSPEFGGSPQPAGQEDSGTHHRTVVPPPGVGLNSMAPP